MPKVTVIVPVYNVAQYIEKCARHLFEQTLEDLEVLFINDCTPDESIEIVAATLREYPQRISQTRIIHQSSNQGSALTRKIGIIEAKGDFIIHCDGDDWVDLDLYEKLYNKAIQCNADIVICDEIHEFTTGQKVDIIPQLPNNCQEVIRNWYQKTIGLFCHNKLVRRSLYTDYDILPWDGLNMWEDNGLMARLFYYGKGLAQIHDSYYHYNRTNQHAMTAAYGERQISQMIAIAEHLTVFFNNLPDSKNYIKTVKAFQFLAKINLITDDFQNLKRYKKIFPNAEEIVPELDHHAFSLKGLFRFRMVQMHLAWLFILLFKIYRFVSR